MFKKRQKKQSIFDFNLLGLNDSAVVSKIVLEEMKGIIDYFFEFENEIERENKNRIDKFLSEIEISKSWELPLKRSIIEKKLKKKRNMIDKVIDKFRCLKNHGENKSIYQSDYKNINKLLLKFLFKLFGSLNDLDNLNYAVCILEDMEIIPTNSKDEIIGLSPVGRWF